MLWNFSPAGWARTSVWNETFAFAVRLHRVDIPEARLNHDQSITEKEVSGKKIATGGAELPLRPNFGLACEFHAPWREKQNGRRGRDCLKTFRGGKAGRALGAPLRARRWSLDIFSIKQIWNRSFHGLRPPPRMKITFVCLSDALLPSPWDRVHFARQRQSKSYIRCPWQK